MSDEDDADCAFSMRKGVKKVEPNNQPFLKVEPNNQPLKKVEPNNQPLKKVEPNKKRFSLLFLASWIKAILLAFPCFVDKSDFARFF
jgi:hypothetical protein